jgi:GABA permease
MRNPFGSEVEAFHFLLATVAAFAAIALAALLGGTWAGVSVWIVATAAAAVVYLRRGRATMPVRTAPAHAGAPGETRILVVADEAPADQALVREIERATAGHRGRVLVVSPAHASPVHRWVSDVDGARVLAQRQLDESLDTLRASGIEAEGELGEDDSLQAIEDALRTFGADGIIIVTPSGRFAGAGERDLVASARERFALPITHVVTGG